MDFIDVNLLTTNLFTDQLVTGRFAGIAELPVGNPQSLGM